MSAWKFLKLELERLVGYLIRIHMDEVMHIHLDPRDQILIRAREISSKYR